MTTTTLQHEDPENYRASQVTVHYDNRIVDLAVDDEGKVIASNKQQVNELTKNGEFKKLDDKDAGHVLSDKNVSQVKDYVSDVEEIERLLELRELEDRKTAIEHIDNRIRKLRKKEEDENQDQNNEDENDGVSREDEEESSEADE